MGGERETTIFGIPIRLDSRVPRGALFLAGPWRDVFSGLERDLLVYDARGGRVLSARQHVEFADGGVLSVVTLEPEPGEEP